MSIHKPVLLRRFLESVKIKPNHTYIDATFGEGHYTRSLLNQGAMVYACDVDPNAIQRASMISKEFPSTFKFYSIPFSNLQTVINQKVDGIVFDIGVSSNQLAEGRGFGFMDDTLDMRMSSNTLKNTLPASTIINHFPEQQLADIIYEYGEETQSRKIARVICKERMVREIKSAKELAEIVGGYLKYTSKHPATKTFQALRIYVNDELGELYKGLCAAENLVKEDGFIADRLVKTFFKFCEGKRLDLIQQETEEELNGSNDEFIPSITRSIGPLAPYEDEVEENIRSRSGKLRVAFRSSGESVNPLINGLQLWKRDRGREMRRQMRNSNGNK